MKTRTERPLRTPRPPVHHEVTSNRVYVGNLHYDASESDLLDLFNGVGEVRNAEVVYHKQNHRSKGYAFIEMAGLEQARRAVEELNDKEFMGRKLLVSGARSTGVDDTHRSSDYARPAPTPAESQPTPPSEPESITPSSASPGSTPA